MSRCRRWQALAVMLVVAAGAHAEPGYAPKAAAIRERPSADARAVGQVSAHEPIEVIRREAGWLQVKAGAATGWIPLGRVRLGAVQPRAPTVSAAAPAPAERSGIRGFSEDELSTAGGNPSAAERVRVIAVPPAQVRDFAAACGLKPRKQDYLDDSERLSRPPPPEVLDE